MVSFNFMSPSTTDRFLNTGYLTDSSTENSSLSQIKSVLQILDCIEYQKKVILKLITT